MRFLSVVAAAALLLTGAVHAQLSMKEIANQCADTAGFNTCWNNALNAAQMCYQHNCAGQGTCNDENDCTSSNPNCVGSCTCVAYEMMVQCALTSCWNMVTSCHYQNLAVAASINCPVALGANAPDFSTKGWVWIPYFPSNSTRPGSCSCNLASVYLIQRAANVDYRNCEGHATSSTYDHTCLCCRDSQQVSAFYDICPNTDPLAAIGSLPSFNNKAFLTSPGCNTLLPTVDCSTYGFANPAGWSSTAQLYTPAGLPPNGTEGLINGQGVIASPIDPTLTWALGSGLQTYTAVAVTTGRAAASAGGGTIVASGTGASALAPASTSASTSSGTSQKSAASKMSLVFAMILPAMISF
ncbi:hypothetical protein VF21_00921 [Pseudogymnoascus sp. 05NY08]|nr:hypothetical protein VF21_00921 [Pseudogymnoascus sp. 05NY08]